MRSERDVNDVPMDWEGAQAARSRINQMLPRVIEMVRAAGLGGSIGVATTTNPGVALGRVEVLHRIFTARYGDGVARRSSERLDFAERVLARQKPLDRLEAPDESRITTPV